MSRFSRACACLSLSLTVLLSACGAGPAGASGSASASLPQTADSSVSQPWEPAQTPDQSKPSQPSDPVDQSGEEGPAQPPQQPEEPTLPEGTQPQRPAASAQPEDPPTVPSAEGSTYDFSQSVPEGESVDNSYFEDAAFIGDSRTDGFLIYSGIGCGENLTSNGLSIFKLKEKKAIKIDGVSYTLLEALALKEYGKVYLSLGINELGYYNDKGFYQAYCDAIDAIRAAQPNAVIYIQGLIPINEQVIRETGGSEYLTNAHLLVYNDLMRQAAEEKQVAFLDLNPYFADENGALPADASKDGVHLKSSYCKKWLEYLKTHTVDFETLYPNTKGTEQ